MHKPIIRGKYLFSVLYELYPIRSIEPGVWARVWINLPATTFEFVDIVSDNIILWPIISQVQHKPKGKGFLSFLS